MPSFPVLRRRGRRYFFPSPFQNKMPDHRLDLIAFVMQTSSVTLDWPQVDLKCSRVEARANNTVLSVVHDIKKYSVPIDLSFS